MEIRIEKGKLICTNVLDQKTFDLLQQQLTSDRFAWFYNDHVVDTKDMMTEEKYQIQFVHWFHQNSTVVTSQENWQLLFPIFEVLQPYSFIRVKANNIPINDNQVVHGFHTDTTVPLSWTAIFYVNTNNGFTEFSDGTKITSQANSMIVFPSNMKHSGSTCTDERSRINININFLADAKNNFVKDIWPEQTKSLVENWI